MLSSRLFFWPPCGEPLSNNIDPQIEGNFNSKEGVTGILISNLGQSCSHVRFTVQARITGIRRI